MVMVRHRMNMSMRPIQRIKHVVDGSATITAAAQITSVLIRAVDAPVLANRDEVVTGSTVHGIYLKIEVASNQVTEAGAILNVYLIIYKNPGNNLTMPAPNAVGASDNKKYIIHQEMIMIENQVSGNPRILFNGVIKIPKGYKRFGPADRISMDFLSPAIDFSMCFQAHYKEFR